MSYGTGNITIDNAVKARAAAEQAREILARRKVMTDHDHLIDALTAALQPFAARNDHHDVGCKCDYCTAREVLNCVADYRRSNLSHAKLDAIIERTRPTARPAEVRQ